jgi:hypothetical protein
MAQNRKKNPGVTREDTPPVPTNGQIGAESLAAIETRLVDPQPVAAPLPASGKLSAIAGAFLDDDEVDLGEVPIVATCSVHRPREHDLFRVRPGAEWRRNALLVEYRGEDPAVGRGPFLIHPRLRGHFGAYGKPHLLLTCITSGANLFLWPLKITKGFGDSWFRSAVVIAQQAENTWVRMWSVKGGHGYQAAISKHDHGLPRWRGESFEELAELAFADYLVDSLNHPLCRALEIE